MEMVSVASTTMMTITTRISMRVKPFAARRRLYADRIFIWFCVGRLTHFFNDLQ